MSRLASAEASASHGVGRGTVSLALRMQCHMAAFERGPKREGGGGQQPSPPAWHPKLFWVQGEAPNPSPKWAGCRLSGCGVGAAGEPPACLSPAFGGFLQQFPPPPRKHEPRSVQGRERPCRGGRRERKQSSHFGVLCTPDSPIKGVFPHEGQELHAQIQRPGHARTCQQRSPQGVFSFHQSSAAQSRVGGTSPPPAKAFHFTLRMSY